MKIQKQRIIALLEAVADEIRHMIKGRLMNRTAWHGPGGGGDMDIRPHGFGHVYEGADWTARSLEIVIRRIADEGAIRSKAFKRRRYGRKCIGLVL